MKKNSTNVREMALTALFAALTAVMAQIAIPIPISPVPISFGMVAIYAAGMLLAPRAAALSQVVYLLLGACGAPVFHNFTGGLGILFGNTGGYLFVYPLMALLISGYFKLYQRKFGAKRKSVAYVVGTALALALALTLEYAGGALYLSYLMQRPLAQILPLAVYPYVPLDIAKIIFSVLILLPIRERLRKQGLLNA